MQSAYSLKLSKTKAKSKTHVYYFIQALVIIRLILLMQLQDDQLQGCFLDSETQTPHNTQHIELSIQIAKKINMHLPANQLRTARRPDNMAPRTFFLDRPFHLLKDPINQPCQQLITSVSTNKVKQRVQNANNLSLQDYFSQRKFQCIYNRLATYRQDSRSFTGKLKGIDYLLDYNWRCFKQLQLQVDILSERGQLNHNLVDSDFQCGNLCRAYTKRQDNELFYYLLIENDVNTYGYNNWFFFRYRNSSKGTVKFKIVNMIKKTWFYNQGMFVSIFSMRKKTQQNVGWFKGGQNICFSQVNLQRSHHNHDHYYSLYFQYNFQYQNDEVYFALNQPYTYTRLVNTLTQLQQNTVNSIKVQTKTLTYSISNNIIPVVRFYKEGKTYQNCILVLARQHSCETVGSFIAEEFMKEIISQGQVQDWLFEQFEIVVIPMVNPDGVVHGMSRVNMAGLDLNRHWGDHILKELTPQTLKIKNYIESLSKKRKIKYMFDLHGHGKKMGSFLFCCKNGDQEHQNYRLMAMAMNKFQQRFSLQSCTYGLTKDKEHTIRSMLSGMGIRHSYTLETSLYGWRDLGNNIHSFTEQDYKSIANSILKSILLIQGSNSLTNDLLKTTREHVIAEMALLMQNIQKNQQLVLQNQVENVSDSDPEGDRLDMKDLLSKCENKLMKKKIQESINSCSKNSKKKKDRQKQKIKYNCRQSRKKINSRQTIAKQTNLSNRLTTSHLNRILSRNQKQSLSFTDNTHNKPNNKTSIFNKTFIGEKWLQRKKQIDRKQTQKLKPRNEKRKDLVQSLNLTRPKLRPRIKTDISRDQPFQKKFTLKTFTHSRRVVTETVQIQQKEQISQVKSRQDRQLQHQKIVKQVREGSHNHLLTDTMSIMRIKPQNKYAPQIKNVCSDCKIQKAALKQQSKQLQQQTTALSQKAMDQVQVRNLKREKQSISKFLPQRSGVRNSNSVFYYFPIF